MKGQADTIGIAMRRALLGEIEGTCITRAKSKKIPHAITGSSSRVETDHSDRWGGISNVSRKIGTFHDSNPLNPQTTQEIEIITYDSPVAESITSLRSDPSSMGHVESRVNQQGPPCKAKYSWVTDSEVVP
ncbi:hypothetical protein V6N13_104564 [Hibiscus sabdariffa]|uniref:Uncharacterized protein n=1 Tax=Hibiscus sabdariffa TaxID=183260 RepID=A0ABR2DE04_9ROSI